MTTVACLGLGYAAAHYVTTLGKRFDRVIGTTRSGRDAAQPTGRNVEIVAFDGATADMVRADGTPDAEQSNDDPS